MNCDVLILNTGVVDLRSRAFTFAAELAGAGGLAKCKTEDLPPYTEEDYETWLKEGRGTAGGPGNTAPLLAKAGVKTAVGVNLGKGDHDGLDVLGRFFHDTMTGNNVDMSATVSHDRLPTGVTFIYEKQEHERGGIVYFPNANDDFNFENFKKAVTRLQPSIVYYMYSGLSERGDADGGKDLADFIAWCRRAGAVTIVDSHTLTGDPQSLIARGETVSEYRLLEPLLAELDIFLTSLDEARLIENTIDRPRTWEDGALERDIARFLDMLTDRYWKDDGRTRLFGITVHDGAWYKSLVPGEGGTPCRKTQSAFMFGEVIDLVGAGDSFRAGLIAYIAQNIDAFRSGAIRFEKAVQMGNLFASLYIKAPLQNRYSYIQPYEKLVPFLAPERDYHTFDGMLKDLLT